MRKLLRAGSTAVLGAVLVFAQSSRTADVELKAAQHKAEIEGDLNGAIQAYKAILAKHRADRAVTAATLVRLADCYRSTGDAEARKLYQDVIRNYADQKDAVATATARLAGEQKPAQNGIVARQRWSMPHNSQQVFGLASRDGRYVPYTDWSDAADLFLHDLETGADRRLTRRGDGGNLFAAYAALSKDNSQIAFSFYDRDHWEVLLAPLHGTGIPASRLLYTSPEADAISVQDWSPDAQVIAVSLRRKDKTGQIGLLNPQDKTLRVLKSIDWRGPTKMLFSPDGRFLAFDIPPDEATDRRDVFVLAIDGSRESHVIAHPAEDVIAGWSPDGKWILFRSDRTGTMGLWKIAFAEGKVQGAPELVQADLPGETLGVVAAGALFSWVNSPRFHGGMVSDIQMAGFDLESGRLVNAPATFVPEFVGTNAYPDWSPDGKLLAYTSRRTKDTPVLVVRSAETGRVVRQVSPKLSMYAGAGARMSPDGRAFATWGTNAKGRRGIYRIDGETGDASPVAVSAGENDEEDFAEPAWSPDGTRIYYVRAVRRGAEREVSLIERNLSSGVERVVITRPRSQLNLQLWSLSPDGRFAAAGKSNGGSQTVSIIPIGGGETRDLQGSFLMWAPDSRSAVVRRRSAAGEVELWRVALDGDASWHLDWKPDSGVRVVRASPDGHRLAIMATSAPKPGEVWALENFLPSKPMKK